jgi:hypothetical protein
MHVECKSDTQRVARKVLSYAPAVDLSRTGHVKPWMFRDIPRYPRLSF